MLVLHISPLCSFVLKFLRFQQPASRHHLPAEVRGAHRLMGHIQDVDRAALLGTVHHRYEFKFHIIRLAIHLVGFFLTTLTYMQKNGPWIKTNATDVYIFLRFIRADRPNQPHPCSIRDQPAGGRK